jgi:CHAT domain-containing protein/tetratricopeptide (TPR) repeat protein
MQSALKAMLGMALYVAASWLMPAAMPPSAWAQTETADTLSQRAAKLVQAGRFADAEPLLKRAVAIQERTLGPDDPLTVANQNMLAVVYYAQARYKEAERLSKRAATIYEKLFGRDHHFTAVSLHILANVYKAQARYAEAEPLYKRALASREKALGRQHPEVVGNRADLADLYRLQGRNAEADAVLKRAPVSQGKTPEPSHQAGEADQLNKRVTELFQAGRFAEAEPLLKRVLAIQERALGPEHPETGATLNMLAVVYYSQARYTDAEPLSKRAVAIYEKLFGRDHHFTAVVLHTLAGVYKGQARYAEAEPLYRRALASREKALGRQHPEVVSTLTDLADLYRAQGRTTEAEALLKVAPVIQGKTIEPANEAIEADQLNKRAMVLFQVGRYAEAEPLWTRALTIVEKMFGSGHPDVATALHNLALVQDRQGRYAQAEPLLKRALAIQEKALGRDHAFSGHILHTLANVYNAQGRYADAESHYKQGLAIREKTLGTDHPDIAENLTNLADLYRSQARYWEAEPLLKRALAIGEKTLGPDHHATATSLMSLAAVYYLQGRHAEAEPLFKRALAVYEKALGQDHPYLAGSVNNLGVFYHLQGRHTDAEPLYKRAVAILQKAHGPEHPGTAEALGNLAELYRDQRRDAEAEPLIKQALALLEKALGPDHHLTGNGLARLAELYRRQGRYAEAEPRFTRAIAILEKALGRDHPATAENVERLGRIRAQQKDWQGAYDLISRATAIYIRRTKRDGDSAFQAAELRNGEATGGDGKSFIAHVDVASHLAASAPARLAALTRETFTIAQWAQRSEAAAALSRMAARFAKGDGGLARLVRQRQDLAGQYRALDKSLIAAVSKAPAERNPGLEKEWRTQLAGVEKLIQEIDARLKQAFPEYAALATPEPLSIEDTQAQLRPTEAIYQVMVDESGAFAWVVTREAVRWQRLADDGNRLAELVEALRCGLDSSRWENERGLTRVEEVRPPTKRVPCRELFGAARRNLPFDPVRAHALYKALFSPFEDLIKDKHLIVVPHGALTALPFQVLVTDAPDPSVSGPERFTRAAWLVARQPVTVLPSVASLKALRRAAGKSAAPNAFAGFGNPLLSGPSGTDRTAWDRQTCAKIVPLVASARVAPVRRVMGDFFRGGLADVEMIRRQTPLPETADEVCAVASDLGSEAVFLGSQATERQLRELNAKRTLRTFRVLHFATHGLVARETRLVGGSLAEPALLLTPPKTPSEADDGLLTASEAAQLDLDADWVILSACNTAAGGGESGSQAFSGLARGFLYAGTRALLVSHWYVNSEAAVRLVTGTFDEMKRDGSIGRAEALRRAMLAQIREGGERAHPSYWAPFVIVGEGG